MGGPLPRKMNVSLWDNNNSVTLTSYFPFVIMSCPKRSHNRYDANACHIRQDCVFDRLSLLQGHADTWNLKEKVREGKWEGPEWMDTLIELFKQYMRKVSQKYHWISLSPNLNCSFVFYTWHPSVCIDGTYCTRPCMEYTESAVAAEEPLCTIIKL